MTGVLAKLVSARQFDHHRGAATRPVRFHGLQAQSARHLYRERIAKNAISSRSVSSGTSSAR